MVNMLTTQLGTRLIILFMLLTTIPLAIIGFLAYENSRRAIEQDMTRHLIATNNLKEAELERWVDDGQRSLRELSRRPLIREYAVILASREPTTAEYQTAHTNIHQDHFSPTLEEEGNFLELFLLDADDGRILVSTNKEREGQYREHEEYFVEGKNHTYVKNVYYSLALEEAVMTIATPVVDRRDGSLVAVLVGRVDLTEISKITEQSSGLRATEETYLINKFNFLITESRFEPGRALQNVIYTEGVNDCLKAQSSQDNVGLYADYRGVPVIGAFQWIPEREWCILTEIDQAEAFASVIALRNTMLGISFFVVLIVALVGLSFSLSITRPLGKLVAGTGEIGRGNLDYRLGMKRGDEIGQLARSFDQMAEDLNTVTASRDELNREIAERVKADEALKEYSERLEEIVEERTQELRDAQEALIRKEKLATLGTLAGSIAHELRNPLGVLANAIYFLKMTLTNASDETTEYLEIISSEIHKSEKIVTDLLGFSRTRLTEKKELEEVAVSTLVAQILMEQPPPEQVEICTNLDNDLPPIFINSQQFEQVLANLVSNAYQAMPNGGKLAVSANLDGDKMILSVCDTGVGVAPENIDKLFEPLFTTKAKGIGLGLAISRNLMEANGGSIEVESEAGKGSTFTMKLPLDRTRGI